MSVGEGMSEGREVRERLWCERGWEVVSEQGWVVSEKGVSEDGL